MRLRNLVLTALATLLPALTHAAVLSNSDYLSPGDGLIVHDATSNLDFLQFSVTQGQTVNAALALNPTFRLATPTQVLQLFADVGGFTAFDDTIRGGKDNLSATALFNAFGATTIFNFGGAAFEADLWGHVTHPGTPGIYDMYEVKLRANGAVNGGAATFVALGNTFSSSSSIESNYLVRTATATPEPQSAILLVVGCLAVALLKLKSGIHSRLSRSFLSKTAIFFRASMACRPSGYRST